MSVADLAQKLISFASVTPQQAGCLDFIQSFLEELHFECWRLPFGAVDNLYARWGKHSPHLCFAGHIDVVPVANPVAWQHNPFSADLKDPQTVYGRGAVDMKGAIAAFLMAAQDVIRSQPTGSISFLLTSDEEGVAVDGTRQVVQWLKDRGEVVDLCLVGEPTSVKQVGDMVKIGRRGSLNVQVTVQGQAGHVAYPENFINPITILMDYLNELKRHPLDQGNELFQPSNLEITSIDVGNPTTNVVVPKAEARFNIRFNNLHNGESLQAYLRKVAAQVSSRITLTTRTSGEAFYCSNPHLTEQIVNCIERITGKPPVLSTSGGTSDARFIKDIAPVVELGLLNAMAHQDNEQAAVSDLNLLQALYAEILSSFLLLKDKSIS
ncbi:succinyl-diaminopimelate desuccinylase [Candidatus Odyssella thessalonicensis]|uniref:succinyl-diaminopimelate desuccinylase n=1 Tax=Candidatus Odyssella thessalonicensis TaxID=84647 RepID=UPI000225ABF5|nr:succinyl-diaminopimelate desuccinylase [Candidatus Odyssella thessalonicensis]